MIPIWWPLWRTRRLELRTNADWRSDFDDLVPIRLIASNVAIWFKLRRSRRKVTTRMDDRAKRSRHDWILDSAVVQLADHGVGTSSLTDVAAYLGMTRSAIYYYAESKEHLVYQVYKRSSDILAAAAVDASSSTGPASEKLAQFIRSISLRPYADIMALAEVGLLSHDQRAAVIERHDVAVSAIATIIYNGIARNELRVCDAQIVARTVISIVHQICTLKQWVRDGDMIVPRPGAHAKLDSLVSGTIDLVLQGWSADRSQPVPVDFIGLDPLRTTPGGAFDRASLAKAKRAEIIAAAARLFNRRGVTSTTLDDIAAELQITKRTLYQHVGDKQTILSVCHRRTREVIGYLYAQSEARVAAGGNPLDAHVNYLRSTALVAMLPQIEPLRPTIGMPELSDADRAELGRYVRWLGEIWQATRERLNQAGLLREHDRAALAQIQFGSANWLAKGLLAVAADQAEHVAEQVVDVLRLGLLPIDRDVQRHDAP